MGYEGRNQYRVYCNHSIIITRDVEFVPPAPAAVLYPPVAVIKEDEEEDSGVASKPSKADSQADTPPQADDTNRSEDNKETFDSIVLKAPAPRTAVDDDVTRPVVGPSQTQSSRNNSGIFSTPQFHEEQSQSTQHTGSNMGHAALTQATTSFEEPRTWEEAMDSSQRSQWQQACQEELALILKSKVWTEVHRNQIEHLNIIGCRWVFKIKCGPKAEVQWYKARLVAKGYTQSYGIHYLETFSPVVKFQTLRLLLVLAVSTHFEIHQMDIKTPFFGQDLSSDEQSIYMELPPGISRRPQKELVLQLHKTLDGL